MPIEERGGMWCDYCRRPVLGRREAVPHLLYAVLTLFSCGLIGIVWAIHSMIGTGEFACPTCGGAVHESQGRLTT